MDPPILSGILTDEVFDGLGVLLGNPCQGVGFVGPFFRHNQAGAFDFKEESVADAPAAADTNGHIVLHGQQADAFVGAGFSSEEIHKHALASGILVGDEAEGRALVCDLLHLLGGSLFVDDLLAFALAYAVKVAIDIGVVQRAGNTVNIKPEQSHHIADDLKIGVVAGHENQSPAFLHKPFDAFNITGGAILPPVVFADDTGRKKDIDCQHYKLLK